MTYQSILVHVDQSRNATERMRIAARIAIAEHAHLIGVAMTGVSRWMYANSAPMFADPGMLINLDMLRDKAQNALTEFEGIVKSMGVESYETRLVDDEAAGGLSMQARYSDLVVIGQTDLEDPSPSVTPDFPEYVVLNCGRPVLIVPYVGHFATVGERALLAWDAGVPAARAVSAAIPLLRRAKIAQVAVFNAAGDLGKHGEQPGADIALYLARHKVKVNVSEQHAESDVGNALLSLATDFASDLIVMGGYGHSRFREILLGGVTRTVLDTMTVPVLMSH
ncbi:universal stress protein [Undibacterium terreum]|uniref:Universal stress protein A n=1 Tax=Undibacterium terreum TaxID=1224302 RepID=A0A916XFN9_9BURK|nr:universal stress protein [Undibacterium terreum]GGC70049.1 universal stress protein A [Undibacterium terreum]